MSQTLKVTYKKAVENKPQFDELLNKVANESSAQPITNLKNPLTALRKVVEKSAEDPKRHYKLEDVNDILRGRLVYDDQRTLDRGIQLFEKELSKTDIRLTKTEDFFKNPEDGYQGYHIDVVFPNGQHSEVQFHTIQSYAASMLTHPTHEEYGDMKPPEIKKMDERMNEGVIKMKPEQARDIALLEERKNDSSMRAAQKEALRVAKG